MPRVIRATSPIAPAYEEAAACRSRYMFLYGGADSGKSYFAAQKKIARAMATAGERILLVRKVYRTCRWSVYQQVKDVMTIGGFESAATFRDSTSDIFFRNGSMMLTCGMDDLNKIKSIAGITSAWVEEGAELDEADVNEIDRRMRGDPLTYFQLLITTNPLPTGRWLKERFVDQAGADVYAKRTTVHDNPFAGADDVRILESIRDDTERAIYLSGEWASYTEGLIYPHWETAPFPETSFRVWGCDFGYENPAAVTKCAFRDVEDGPFAHVHEAVYEAGLTNDMLADRIWEAGYEKGEEMWCDPAEPKSIEELRKRGINAKKADNSVEEGIKAVQRYKLRFTPSSVNLHREASFYRRQPDTTRYAEEGTFLEKPIKKNDHGMDAMRYPIFNSRKKKRKLISKRRRATNGAVAA